MLKEKQTEATTTGAAVLPAPAARSKRYDEAIKADHALASLCAALDVSRSGYHAWQQAGASRRQQTDTALLADIRQIHAEHHQRYGAPRIQHELRERGQRHGTKRIARLMR